MTWMLASRRGAERSGDTRVACSMRSSCAAAPAQYELSTINASASVRCRAVSMSPSDGLHRECHCSGDSQLTRVETGQALRGCDERWKGCSPKAVIGLGLTDRSVLLPMSPGCPELGRLEPSPFADLPCEPNPSPNRPIRARSRH